MDVETTPVTFTVEELWLLQGVVRHEAPNEEEEWKRPPVSFTLNAEVCYALVTCTRYNLTEYTLMLSLGDCLAVDWNLEQDAKTPEGADGRIVLLKTFEARRRLAGLDEEEELEAVTDYSYSQGVRNANTSTNKTDNKDFSSHAHKTRANKES